MTKLTIFNTVVGTVCDVTSAYSKITVRNRIGNDIRVVVNKDDETGEIIIELIKPRELVYG